MADATVYGRIHNSIDALSGVSANSQKVHVNSNSSRFGVKGSADLGDGLTGVFQAESGISTVGGGGEDGNGGAGGTSSTGQLFTNSRDVYIGLSSADYGTLLVGRLPAANQWVYDSNLFADQIGDAATFTNAGIPGRVNGAVHYVTPKIADMLTLTATWLPASGLEAQQNTTTAPTPRASNTVGFYAAANVVGADIKVVYFDVNGSAVKPLSIAASYDLGNGAMVTGQYVSVNTQGGPTDNVFNVGGQ